MANTEQNKSFIIYLKDLFDKNFIIPIYQRNYDWDFTLVKQLIDDIIDFCKNNRNNNYSLGVMQVYNRSKDTNNCLYEVVDGQQRLTTLYLLFCALRDVKGDLDENSYEKKLKLYPQFECRNKVKATLEALKNGVSDEHSLLDNKIRFTYRCILQYLEKRLKDNFSGSTPGAGECGADVPWDVEVIGISLLMSFFLFPVYITCSPLLPSL